nr:PREDICTED: putative odorant-binding protein A5 [Bemisia tabaci]XP_018906379.1 PREDICTED: putative odorant-binding protein A5 [Bemisia tabaci]XP_018906380.1 PREDICTED: putative odorant-binding protein A5 [Bemisia tabaci]
MLVGPDEPSRDAPTDREFLHWLIVNIPIDAVICGDERVEYIPPTPKKDTGVHRYVYVVLQQAHDKMTFDEPHLKNTSIAERKNWSTKAFMKKYGFKEAHAVNFFKSEWQDPSITTKSPWDVEAPRKRRLRTKKPATL